jgi:hypothetical protein
MDMVSLPNRARVESVLDVVRRGFSYTPIIPKPATIQLGGRLRPILSGMLGVCVALAQACAGSGSSVGSGPNVVEAPGVERLSAVPARPQLMFVSVAADDSHRRLAVAPLDALDRSLFVTPLACERVYFSGGRGICLSTEASGTSAAHFADIFDDRFERLHRIKLTGPPSRVRVSPDGRRAGATVFESGHSYAQEGFSTRTTVIDLERGLTMGDLEEYTVWRDGRRFTSVDFNFWGLTFEKDGNGFYATLDTRGVQYLVKGNIDRREIRIVRPDVECPSLSPDNTKLVFKRLVGARSRGWWQLSRLDLLTNTETVLSTESRSVDDQVEWLDDTAVMYHITGSGTAADIWVLPVDGVSRPRRLLASAYSPSVVR